MDYNVYLFFKS